jgi:hypothetical protein
MSLRICRQSSQIVFLNAMLKQPGANWLEDYSVAFPDMTTPPLFPGFDGLMTLSRREGVDIRPTLLRVLTDLYVQTSAHSADEERQFVELTSRLIDQVDDATRAAVRARLAIYPGTPAATLQTRLACAGGSGNFRSPLGAAAGQATDRGAIADGIEFVDAAQGRR